MEESTIKLLDTFNLDIEILDISNSNIKGIVDLSKFKKLKELNCSNNKITEIILPHMEIDIIDCSNNLIENLFLVNIKKFNFNQNPLKYIDFLQFSRYNIQPQIPLELIPNTVERLHFIGDFNQPIDNLQFGIKNLVLSDKFNFPVNNLPNSIENLYFGNDFNQNVDLLPNSLTILHFGNKFSQPVDLLPSNLKELKFWCNFNQLIDNLPDSIEVLEVGDYFNKKVNKLPKLIKSIKVSNILALENVKLFPEEFHNIIHCNKTW